MQAGVLFPSYLFLFLFGSGASLGLPVSIPPAPEEPVLSAIAPEGMPFLTMWAGTVAPELKSTNQTELLLAEPEVQQFVARIEERCPRRRDARGRAGRSPGGRAPGEMLDFAKTLLTRPAALFVEDVKIAPPQGGPGPQTGPPIPEIRAGRS